MDGILIERPYHDEDFYEASSFSSYRLDFSAVEDAKYYGAPYRNPDLPPVESYVYGDVQSLYDFSIDCLTLNVFGYDIAGMQYFDSKNDPYLNGDLFYLSKDENGLIKDSSIFAYNFGVNERRAAFALSDPGINQDIVPTRGFTFFNRDMLALPGAISVPEPSSLAMMIFSMLCLLACRTLKHS